MKSIILGACLALLVGCGNVEDAQSNEEGSGELGQQEAPLWIGSTSEELPPLNCDAGYIINGMECSGSYCDNIRVNCTYGGVTHGASYWTTRFSEEGTNWRECRYGEAVTGIACYGSYCDSVALECTAISGRPLGSCFWTTSWITDGSSPYYSPANTFIVGAQCRGQYCDDMRFLVCNFG